MNPAQRLAGRTRAAVAAVPGGGAALLLVARFLPRGALVLSVLTFVGYAMGLVRDRAFAQTFGAGADLDAYNAALQLPEIALDVLVTGGLQAALVPVFARLRDEDEGAAVAFGRTILTLAIIVAAVAVAVMDVFAPQTIDLLGLHFGATQRELYVGLFRITSLTMLVFAASFTLGELLVVERRFVTYGLAPLLYNAGIAGGALVLGPRYGVTGAALGTVAGALLHLAIRVWGLRGTPVELRPLLALRTRALLEYVRLALPKSISQPIEQLTFQNFNAIATTLGAGVLSSLSFARNFQSVPVALVGVSFAVAAFPALSDAAAAGDRGRFGRILATNAASIGALTIAAAVALFAVAELAIRVLLGGGRFDQAAIERTSLMLATFAVSVPLESLTHLFARALYATRNTLLPVAASVVGFAVAVGSAGSLAAPLGVVALPLAYALGMAAKLAVLVAATLPRARAIGRAREPELARPV